MELGRGSIVAGILIAVALGIGMAWWNEPERSEPQRSERQAPSEQRADTITAEKAPKLYKWMDDNGVWNYTDQAPADRDYEVVRGTPRVTSVPTVVPDVPSTPGTSDIPPPPE